MTPVGSRRACSRSVCSRSCRSRSTRSRSARVRLLAGLSPAWFILVAPACHTRHAAAPLITALTPSSADVTRGDPVDVVVAGRGFDSLNTVHFGWVRLQQVPRTSPTSLKFQVPRDDEQVPDRGGAPVQPLPSGTYDVRVSTTRGSSNALAFTLTGVVR